MIVWIVAAIRDENIEANYFCFYYCILPNNTP